MIIETLRELIRQHHCESPTSAHSIVVGVDAGTHLFRVATSGIPVPGVQITPDDDEVVQLDGMSVRLRHDQPLGSAQIIHNAELSAKRCCDSVCIRTILIALKSGAA